MERESKLFEIVFALCPASRLASLLNGWKKQSDQNRNDGDNNQ
jgi:hypothetical protein